MEAASAVGRLRARRFERECERLRPFGEAYVLRRFGRELSRADAEDVVAEVLIRLHERAGRGIEAENLRALFLTSVHNAAIDMLRARSARPQTVALDAALGVPAAASAPAERAESRDNVVRLQEALARMRDGYRETIMLRFGLGLSVPEIAAHFGISETAAKKRVLRAGRQVRKRMAQIEGEEFCPQMRKLACGFAFEREVAGIDLEAEGEALHAHFSHCGACRSYLTRLRAELHELGSGALAALLGGERVAGHVHLLHRLGHLAGGAADAAQAGVGRLRHLALRGVAPFSSGDGPAGAVMGTGQKIAAVCGAGAAATATCVLSGAVGPGIGATTHHPDRPQHPAAKVKRLSSADVPAPEAVQAPDPVSAESEPSPAEGRDSGASGGGAHAAEPSPSAPTAAPETAPEPQSSPPSEFGIEGSSSSSQPTETGSADEGSAGEEAPQAPSAASRPSGAEAQSPSSGSGSGASEGAGSVGFHG